MPRSVRTDRLTRREYGPYPHQPGEHDATASAFIFDVSGPEPRLWLHLHKKLGKWMQFGGHVELNETAWQAVCHEIEEESGFNIGQLKLLQPELRIGHVPGCEVHPMPAVENTHHFPELDHYHTDREYVFTTTMSPQNGVAENESSQLRLFTEGELERADELNISENVSTIGLFMLRGVLPAWEAVDPSEFNR